MHVPFVNLSNSTDILRKEIMSSIGRVVDSGSYILGQELATFENELSRYLHKGYCVGVANGTEALELSLMASGIGKCDRVALPVNTFAATALAVIRVGAIPIFVDCVEETYLIDIEKIPSNIEAVIPVHLYGQQVPIDTLRSNINRNVVIIEDAAQAIGSLYKNKDIGHYSDTATVSFYPTKNLGALGDGGAIVTNNNDIYKRLLKLRNYGSDIKYRHDIVGYNSRLDELQAAILKVKLQYLEDFNSCRRDAANYYNEILPLQVGRPTIGDYNEHTYHLYVVQTDDRDECRKYLSSRSIESNIHYPYPLHLQPAFSYLGYKRGDFPIAEKLSGRILSLPMFPEITRIEQDAVADGMRSFFGRM